MLIVFLITFAFQSSLALDMEGAKEKACFDYPSLPFDALTQALGFPFYYPMMSRLQLYRKVALMSYPLPPGDIIEGSVYYDSCIRWTFFSESTLQISGYGGTRLINYAITPASGGIEKGLDFTTPLWNFPGGKGNTRVTLTDARTFAVEVCCYEDNQFTWGVLSTTPTLSTETAQIITAHLVEDLGFNIDYFTELRYDTCLGGKEGKNGTGVYGV